MESESEHIQLVVRNEENYKSSEAPDNSKSKDHFSHSGKHQYWIDATRIFASYMVVLVHACYYSLTKNPEDDYTFNWYSSRFWNSINRPCVPLFVMVSDFTSGICICVLVCI
ncbi:hypothetical protein PIROE2DRAFT_10485 [Piromyces sp. E2]|nr:hypothetical protein PIROE2DRAFT_10485 [Piromyces sp. E2]|eukprot:OUM63071.1 hypothetical protein PIROE2DRAFT_10485 [Piromyces sp. E2]